jgi:hypothetical protein
MGKSTKEIEFISKIAYPSLEGVIKLRNGCKITFDASKPKRIGYIQGYSDSERSKEATLKEYKSELESKVLEYKLTMKAWRNENDTTAAKGIYEAYENVFHLMLELIHTVK